ncbi:MAG: hypothetical protein LBG87_07820 [Spirochaetaceae bacterium]|jgi:hypothetical protein|nr:hypothetical protein [Spirochaetaceae bacterium]
MKRAISVILFGLLCSGAFADDELDFYKQQLDNALTAVDQLSILQLARGPADTSDPANPTYPEEIENAGELYAHALTRVLQLYPNLRGQKEYNAANDSFRIIAEGLTEDQKDAGPSLWRVVKLVPDALVKMEAIQAVGRIKAEELLPQVVQILKDNNSTPYSNRLASERIAYGAIDALKNFGDPSGYLPVFFALNGWYSNSLKKVADKALPEISEDPVGPLTEVLHDGAYTLEEKFIALCAIEEKSSDEAAKGKAAIAALYEGWRGHSSNPKMQKEAVKMRKLAIDMIARYGIDGADDDEKKQAYALLDRSYRFGADTEEHLGVVHALGGEKLATEESANLLSSYIAILNSNLEREIVNQQDERYMRTLIPSLGATGQASGKPVLRHTISLGWSAGVRQVAQKALDNLGK